MNSGKRHRSYVCMTLFMLFCSMERVSSSALIMSHFGLEMQSRCVSELQRWFSCVFIKNVHIFLLHVLTI